MRDLMNPLITVVIPTRDRADTLKFTLETALDQVNDNFQIVVSDNFSQDNTKEVVEAFSDSRITYVNTGRRLSMCDNWDFAFNYVRGEYVIYIGDDDGLMPGAINRLVDMIKIRPSPIYCWEYHIYNWPTESNPAAIVSITPVRCAFEVDLNKLVRFSLKWGGIRNYLLPAAYHGAVSTSILEAIRKNTGRVFHSLAPDLFTNYALPAFSNKAVNVGVALTVAGSSGKSNSSRARANDGVANFQKFVQEYGTYQFHPTLFPDAPYILNLVQDSTLVAMDLFPEFYAKFRFNYEAMWAHMVWGGRYERTLATAENKLSSMFHLLGLRKKIRAYHSFRVTHFLFYFLIGALLKLRAVLKTKIHRRKIDECVNVNTCPQNIHAFVKLAGQIESRNI